MKKALVPKTNPPPLIGRFSPSKTGGTPAPAGRATSPGTNSRISGNGETPRSALKRRTPQRNQEPGSPSPAAQAANNAMDPHSNLTNPTIERGRVVILKSDLILLQMEIDARSPGETGMLQMQSFLQEIHWSPDPVLTMQRTSNLQRMLIAKMNELAKASLPPSDKSALQPDGTASERSSVGSLVSFFKFERQRQSTQSGVYSQPRVPPQQSMGGTLLPDLETVPSEGDVLARTDGPLGKSSEGAPGGKMTPDQINSRLQQLNTNLANKKGLGGGTASTASGGIVGDPSSMNNNGNTTATFGHSQHQPHAGSATAGGTEDPDLEMVPPLTNIVRRNSQQQHSSLAAADPTALDVVPGLMASGSAVVTAVTSPVVVSSTLVDRPSFATPNATLVPTSQTENKRVQFLEAKLAFLTRLEEALFEVDPQDTLVSLMTHHEALEFMGLRVQMSNLRKDLPRPSVHRNSSTGGVVQGLSLMNGLYRGGVLGGVHESPTTASVGGVPTPSALGARGMKGARDSGVIQQDVEVLIQQTVQQVCTNAKAILAVQNAVIACLLDSLDKQGLDLDGAKGKRDDLLVSFDHRIKTQQAAFDEERRELHTRMEQDANDLQRMTATGANGSDFFAAGTSNFSVVGGLVGGSRPGSRSMQWSRPGSRGANTPAGGRMSALPGIPPRANSSLEMRDLTGENKVHTSVVVSDTTINTSVNSQQQSSKGLGHWSSMPPRSASAMGAKRPPIVATLESENDGASEKNLRRMVKRQQAIIQALSAAKDQAEAASSNVAA